MRMNIILEYDIHLASYMCLPISNNLNTNYYGCGKGEESSMLYSGMPTTNMKNINYKKVISDFSHF